MGQNVVSQVKTQDHEGYNALQLGFEINKRATKPIVGHIKKAGIKETPRFFVEVKTDDVSSFTPGSAITLVEVFEPGDIVDVVGTSKGKGYAGVVKRHGFAGGPRTHGQSDRERAPGSSGQTTTPGRVYRGKKMSGRMGNERVTVKNLEVLGIDGDTIFVKGLIPGAKGSIVMVTKVGKNKKHTPLWAEKPEVEEKTEAEAETTAPEPQEAVEEVKNADETVKTAEEEVATQESVETAQENVGPKVVENEESQETGAGQEVK
jgi:large subunit ribosomal protein L3